MKYLITGGAGFIGSHLVDSLINTGNEVVVLDNFSSGKHENLAAHISNPLLSIVEGGVQDAETCNSAAMGTDGVIHLAAIASVEICNTQPEFAYRVNVTGTENVLSAAVSAGAGRFVFASSASVYGDCDILPLTEDLVAMGKAAPISSYGKHKLEGEQLCGKYLRKGLSTVMYRFFNVFGERQDPTSPYSGVISIFMDRIASNKEVTIHGDGEQTRDFIYVNDLVRVIVNHGLDSNAEPGIFNIGRSEQTSINAIFHIIADLYRKKITPAYTVSRKGDIKHSLSNTEKIRSVTDWDPEMSIEEGLKNMVRK